MRGSWVPFGIAQFASGPFLWPFPDARRSRKQIGNSASVPRISESVVDMIARPGAGDRKVRTVDEREEAVRASEAGSPAIKVWISEELEAQARQTWGHDHRN